MFVFRQNWNFYIAVSVLKELPFAPPFSALVTTQEAENSKSIILPSMRFIAFLRNVILEGYF